MLSRTSRPLQSGERSQKNLQWDWGPRKEGRQPNPWGDPEGSTCAPKITHICVGIEHPSQELEVPGTGYGGYQLRFLPVSTRTRKRGSDQRDHRLGDQGSGSLTRELLCDIEFFLVPGQSVGPDSHLSPKTSLETVKHCRALRAEGGTGLRSQAKISRSRVHGQTTLLTH